MVWPSRRALGEVDDRRAPVLVAGEHVHAGQDQDFEVEVGGELRGAERVAEVEASVVVATVVEVHPAGHLGEFPGRAEQFVAGVLGVLGGVEDVVDAAQALDGEVGDEVAAGLAVEGI